MDCVFGERGGVGGWVDGEVERRGDRWVGGWVGGYLGSQHDGLHSRRTDFVDGGGDSFHRKASSHGGLAGGGLSDRGTDLGR